MSRQDDWKIDVQPEEKVPIPSFIRLFVIYRILEPYIFDNTTTKVTSHDAIRSLLVTVFNNKEEQEAALTILSQLIRNGIKKYMSNFFDIDIHPIIIEKIHNQLILTTFSQEYANITKYTTSKNNCNINYNNTNDNDTISQSLVFNSNDLMSCIFQFLANKDNDLIHCSLVNSHWLYYIFNPNLCDEIDFSVLWKTSDQGEAVITKMQARLWQRVIKVKSIIYRTPRISKLSKNKRHDELLSKISMLSNVEKIICRTPPSNIIVLKALIQQCRENIKYFDVAISAKRKHINENVLSPLTLPNAEYIIIHDKYFNIIWSNKCQIMKWSMLAGISTNWCNFVINNCDCSGIKYLVIDDISFDKNINNNMNININYNVNLNENENGNENENENEMSILSLLAKKFANIEKLDIVLELKDYTSNLGLLWQGLAPIIDKNNTYVTLTIQKSRSRVKSQLLRFIDTNDIRINQIISRLYSDEMNESLYVIIRKCQHLERINIINRLIVKNGVSLAKFIAKLKKIALGSDKTTTTTTTNCGMPELKTIELIQSLPISSVDIVNDLLSLKFIIQRRIFIMLVITLEIVNFFDEAAFLLKFKLFCQKIYILMFEHQVPINIQLKFEHFGAFNDNSIEKMRQVFNSVFDEKILLSQLKLSKKQCNKYCTSMEIPVISLRKSETNNGQLKFCAANAHEINKILPIRSQHVYTCTDEQNFTT